MCAHISGIGDGCYLDWILDVKFMRKKSKYKPKPVIRDTMAYVKSGLMHMVNMKEQLVALQLKNHLALEALRTGTAVKEDIDVLISAFNITEALAKAKIGDDYLADIKSAQDALWECAKRGVSLNYKFILNGPELKAINFVMELHDAQLEASTVKDIEKAIDYVNKMIVHGNARPIVERL